MNALAKIENVGTSVASWRDEFTRVMSSDVDPDKFIAAVTTALTLNPELVSKCTAESIKNSCIKAAYDGLRPDGREGALVAYGNVAQWMPMVYGIRKKAREHDGIIIKAEVVYERDKFLVMMGDDERIEHEPAPMNVDAGPIIASYAIFRKGEEILHREIMRRADIDAVRKASKSSNSPAWTNWFGEMAKKAAVNRGKKSVPMSDAVLAVIDRDNDHYDAMRDITPGPSLSERFSGQSGAQGFSPDNVPRALQDQSPADKPRSEAQPSGDALKTTAQAKDDKSTASARPADDSAGGPQPSSPTANGGAQSSPRSSQGGGSGEPTPRLPAQTWQDYHSALARMQSAESLKKAHEEFWRAAKAGRLGDADASFGKQIYEAHEGRVGGQVPGEMVAENVKKWIEEECAAAN